MKKLPLAISLLSLLLVAGCGSDSTQDQEEKDKNQTNEVADKEKNEENTDSKDEPTENQDQNKENDDTASDEQTTDKNDETNVGAKEQTLTYNIKGETKTEKATLVNSDNQDFSIYTLPQFELTGEEPRKDMLFSNAVDSNSMRIELLESPNWSTLEENIKLELEYVSKEITNPTDPALQIDNASIFEAVNNDERVTIYLIKNEKMPMKLTLFTSKNEDYREAFVQMAKTIKAK